MGEGLAVAAGLLVGESVGLGVGLGVSSVTVQLYVEVKPAVSMY